MNTQTYTQRAQARPRPRIAVVTMGVKLGDETRGYTRFRVLSEMLVEQGFDVDLITSSFQHWEKAQRDTSKTCYQGLPYNVVFIDEPGYTRNLDLQRIHSHHVAAKNLRERFERTAGRYSLIYSEIPPNDVARVCAEYASEQNIPYVADINDLWPEAMRMVVNIPVLSDVAFYPFARDAKRVYQLLSGAVGTSDEYTARPAKDRTTPYPHATVYVGNDLAAFDEGAREHMADVVKPAGELWAVYAGTLGASYDLATLIKAAALLEKRRAAHTARTAAGSVIYHIRTGRVTIRAISSFSKYRNPILSGLRNGKRSIGGKGFHNRCCSCRESLTPGSLKIYRLPRRIHDTGHHRAGHEKVVFRLLPVGKPNGVCSPIHLYRVTDFKGPGRCKYTGNQPECPV
mgnify:CR=1 FL=1